MDVSSVGVTIERVPLDRFTPRLPGWDSFMVREFGLLTDGRKVHADSGLSVDFGPGQAPDVDDLREDADLYLSGRFGGYRWYWHALSEALIEEGIEVAPEALDLLPRVPAEIRLHER
jgi:hypothetical protein